MTFSDNSLVKEFSRKVMTYSRNQRTIQAVNLPDGCWNSGSCGGSTQMLIEMVLDLGAVVLNCRDLSVSDHGSVVAVNIFLALVCTCIAIGHLLERDQRGLITGGVILLVS